MQHEHTFIDTLAETLTRAINRQTQQWFKDRKVNWRCIVKCDLHTNDPEDEYDSGTIDLDFASTNNITNCASPKLTMLQQHPELAATGFETPSAFLSRVCEYDLSTSTSATITQEELDLTIEEIFKLDTLDRLSKAARIVLADLGLSASKGGLRIPVALTYWPHPKTKTIAGASGDLLLVFDSEDNWRDLIVALCILHDIRVAYREIPCNALYLNLDELRTIPDLDSTMRAVHLW